MIALREFLKVKDNKIELILPKEFEGKEVEVIILPKNEEEDDCEFWSEEEIKNIGKIGLISASFEDDGEDYSKW